MNCYAELQTSIARTYLLHSAHESVALRLFLTSWLWLDMRPAGTTVCSRGGWRAVEGEQLVCAGGRRVNGRRRRLLTLSRGNAQLILGSRFR